VTNVMIEIETVNSTYHVDTEAKRVRRSEPHPVATHRLADGEWHDYIEYHPSFAGTLLFWFGEGEYTRTSTVKSEREMETV
jgi:hypothetical protein